MKKISLIAASLLLTSSLYGAEQDSLFLGLELGSGSGTVSLNNDNGSYTFTDSEDVSTSDTKLYVGFGTWYLFSQNGTIETDTRFLGDVDYSVLGIGKIVKFNPIGTDSLKPYFDIELGLESGTINDYIFAGNDEDVAGLMVGFDFGLDYEVIKGLSLKAAVGYDLHAVNDDTATNGTWNFTSMGVNFGAAYSF